MKHFSLFFVLIFAFQAMGATITDNVLNLGTGTGAKRINFRNGPAFIGWEPTTGKITFSNDGTIVKALGSGSGGGSGAFSMIDNGGFEDGLTSGWESTAGRVTAATGTNALMENTSAIFDPTAQNDYLRTAIRTVPRGLRGTSCEARFKYTGGDNANLSARVVNGAGAVLGAFNNGTNANVLPVHTLPDYESIFFKCPTEGEITSAATNGNIRLEIYQGTTTNAAAITVDDVHLGSLIGLVETTLPDVLTARIAANGTVVAENTDWIAGNCSIGGTNNNGTYCGIVPGTFSSSNYGCVANSIAETAGGAITSVFSTGIGTLTLSTNSGAAVDKTVTCTRLGADAKQSVQVYKSIPKTSDNANSFSVFVGADNGFGNAGPANPFVSCTGTSSKTCSFVSGFFKAAPICTVTPIGIGSQVVIGSLDANSFNYTTFNAAGTAAASAAFITCNRSVTDYRMPTVQPVIVGNWTTTPNMNNSILYSVSFGGAGGYVSGANCTSSPCVMSNNYGGIFTSATRIQPGQYNLYIDTSKVGNDKSNCTCSSVLWGSAGAVCRTYQNGNFVKVETMNPAGTLVDTASQVVCHAPLQ